MCQPWGWEAVSTGFLPRFHILTPKNRPPTNTLHLMPLKQAQIQVYGNPLEVIWPRMAGEFRILGRFRHIQNLDKS